MTMLNKSIFVIPVDMENKSIDEIAKEATIKIIDVVEQVGKEREKEVEKNEKTSKCAEDL